MVVEDQDRFLVVETPQGNWSFPGGFMRWREYPMETALRECEEETGLRLRLHGVVGYYSTISKGFGTMSTLTVVYHGEVQGGSLRKSIEGQPRWVARAELLGKLKVHSADIFEDYESYRQRQAEAEPSQA